MPSSKSDIPLKCLCGKMRGTFVDATRSHSGRFVCLCDDCQAYAHALGRAKDVLDANGGTDILPMTPAKIKITQGKEYLQCLRLSDKGMFRWYAGCCKTPIANSPPGSMPYAGTVHTAMDHQGDGRSREEALGPVKARVQAKFGIGPLPPDAHQTMAFRTMFDVIRFMFFAYVGGGAKPSPFFDEKTGKPAVEPKILSVTERDELRKLCGPG